ncbi:glutamate ABC transporter substrate-binding protein [Streptomyces sp. KK5PA1]|uniref:Glutamate ABC transporter substrate-binding protein n=1 Tax=Actinacidiphila acididurans TaxID=2784346 RepID=A0ABS2TYH1_9ACTN|nr:glutamate ABC transporter substrate-binding protein [Actinacidiphila acididurans]
MRGRIAVAAIAAACALAVTAVLVPAGRGQAAAGKGAAEGRTQAPVGAAARRAPAEGPAGPRDDCSASLNPASGSTDGAAVARIRARGRLLVGVDQNSYLWGFRDPATGRLAGFDIDIVKAIAQDVLGDSSKVQYLTVPTSQRIQAITDHRVDMVVRTMTVNCARAAQVAFSVPYFTAGQQLLTAKDSPVTGFDDSLKGRRVCTAKGSTGQSALDAAPHGARILALDNQLDCLVRLQLGQADAVFTDNALAAGQAAQDPTTHLVGQPVTREPYGVAMNLADDDLVRRVNQVLAQYESGGADSAWMQSYRTWLAKELPGITGPPAPVYR